ncbi:helix-turn-helix domain-containing protein (plasmid) [Borreliella americana]
MSVNRAYKYRIYTNTNKKIFFEIIQMCNILYKKF